MGERGGHPAQQAGVDRAPVAAVKDPGNSAHRVSPGY
jgi:hypothetical protein